MSERKVGIKDLVDAVHETLEGDLSKAAIRHCIDALVDEIHIGVEAGQSIGIPGLGTFKPGFTAARKARNPTTGEQLDVPRKGKVGFKPAPALREKALEAFPE